MSIKNGTLSAKIFNGGPSDYTGAGGGRQFVVSFPGGEGLFPAGEVPDLKNGAETTVEVKLEDLVSAIKFDRTQKTELTLALAPPDDQPDNDAKTILYTPPGDAQGEPQKTFQSRLLRVKNDTPEPVTVFLQYRADENDTSAWLPDAPPQIPRGGGGPTPGLVTFRFDLKPGEDRVLTNQDLHIFASRARLFARGPSRSWEEHRNRDLWLVPEIDGGKHQYKAASMETFTYRLALPPGSVDAGPLPDANAPVKGPSSTEVAVANLTPPVMTTPVTAGIPIPPLPATLQPPAPPGDADLEVIHFTIGPDGRFEGTVINRGPADYPGKRRWYVLGQNGTPIAQGEVHPLGMNDQLAVAGQIPGLTPGAAYFLRLSPGDKNEGNDTAGLLFKRPSKSDLAVSNVIVEVKGGVATLKATITNQGPEPYVAAAGPRKCTLGDQAGRMPNEIKDVPDLDVNGTTEVTTDVSALAASNGVFFVKLGGSDADPTNDQGQYNFTPQGGGDADLAIADVKVEGTKVRVTVTNNGPEDYKKSAGRTLKFSDGSAEIGLPDIANKESKLYYFPLAALPTTIETYTATLSPGDKDAGNDTLDTIFDPANAAGKTSNLDVVSLACDGTTVTATVLNRGPDALDTERKVVFTADLAGDTPVEKAVPTPLAKNDTITVTARLSDMVGPPPAPGEILVLQARPREGGGKGIKVFKVPGNPVAARSVDLAVDTPVFDPAGKRFTVKVSNLGPDDLTVNPRLRVTAFGPGLTSWTQTVTLDPIPRNVEVHGPIG